MIVTDHGNHIQGEITNEAGGVVKIWMVWRINNDPIRGNFMQTE